MCVEESPRDGVAGNSERVKIAGTKGQRQRLLCTSMAQQPVREPDVRSGIVRIQIEGSSVLSLGLGPLPLPHVDVCQLNVCVGELWI